jgi:hypothetical protein
MAMTTVMTMLCLAGIAFNVRFLVAVCKECKARRLSTGCAWVPVRTSAHYPNGGNTQNQLLERHQNRGGLFSGVLDNIDGSEKGYF